MVRIALFLAVLFVSVAASALLKEERYSTPHGVFVLETEDEKGGACLATPRQVLVTPKAKRILLYVHIGYVFDVYVDGAELYVIATSGIWQWMPKQEILTDLHPVRHSGTLTWITKTNLRGFYGTEYTGSCEADRSFKGILYFDAQTRRWQWIPYIGAADIGTVVNGEKLIDGKYRFTHRSKLGESNTILNTVEGTIKRE